ncbi:putative secreted effector protein [Blumeria graminis f. sp. tritici 96224]|uniref:Putative secreted effector protein n=2 Tax=Blumeria graminis f. sp. tritici 96224 TaxID=1268274 RepID=A0A656KFH0_BLUGR|nr:putative secreted effector protein [Blumeria graminis f. sp. tritici 96224]
MISCAFVLISRFLNPNKPLEKDSTGYPSHLERIVILGSDGGRSYYDAYDNPSPGKFPVPDTKYNLATTIKKVVRNGTNLKAYCSHTMSSVKIAELLGGVISTETAYYHNPVPAYPNYETCLALIKKSTDIHNAEPNHQQGQSPLSAETLNHSKRCSNSDLINLAYRGQISVSGAYGYLAPRNSKAQLKVFMDQHVQFEDFLKSHHANGIVKNHGKILVLYFGHLHVFKKDSRNSIWFPVTQIYMIIERSVQATSRLDLTGVSQDLRVRDQDLLKFVQYVKAWVKPGPIRNVKDIELKVSNLLEALKDARRAVGQKPVRIARRSVPWWNEECKLKHLKFRESKEDPE